MNNEFENLTNSAPDAEEIQKGKSLFDIDFGDTENLKTNNLTETQNESGNVSLPEAEPAKESEPSTPPTAPEVEPRASATPAPEVESPAPIVPEASVPETKPAVPSAPETESAAPSAPEAPSPEVKPAATAATANTTPAVAQSIPNAPVNPAPTAPYPYYGAPQNAPYPQPPYNNPAFYQTQPSAPQYPPYNRGNVPYPAPNPYYGPTEPRHSKGSAALVTVLWVLVAVFALGFLVLCGYVASRTPAQQEDNTRPGGFVSREEDTTPATTEEEKEDEESTLPQNDIVEGGVIPNDDDSVYSKNSSITLLDPPKDKLDTSKYTTQYAYSQISDSTVGIVCYSGKVTENSDPESTGTGIVITKDGYIATNSHVIGDSRSLYNVRVVLNDGTTYEAKIIGYDSRTDLAVLKVNADNLTPAVFCDSDKTQIGDDVIAIGNPGGMDFQNSLTKGIISAKDRELSLSAQVSYIQTDAAINPGNSGGPLCNMYGQVIGINTAKISESSYEGMGFAIPSRTAKKVIDDLMHQGYVSGRVRLGISGQPVTESMQKYYDIPLGILIGEVTKGGPCDGTGLEPNDVITAIDGEEVTSFKDVYAILEKHSPSDEVTLSVYRSSTQEELEIKVILQADEGQTQQ